MLHSILQKLQVCLSFLNAETGLKGTNYPKYFYIKPYPM